MRSSARGYHREFRLARLQKAQSSKTPRLDLPAVDFRGSAEPAFRYLAKQKIAEYADPLRGAQFLGVDEIGLDRRPGQFGQDP
jgi:hypothetical protein